MRKTLKDAREGKGMTQKQVAEYLRISETAYQNIEYGLCIGRIQHWDNLEDLFDINQRKLREITDPIGPQDSQA